MQRIRQLVNSTGAAIRAHVLPAACAGDLLHILAGFPAGAEQQAFSASGRAGETRDEYAGL